MDTTLLELQMEAMEIPFAVIVDTKTWEFVRIGCEGPFVGLYNALLADTFVASDTLWSIDGRPSPRIWKQGNAVCAVFMATTTLLVGLFYISELDLLAERRWSQRLKQTICSLFSHSYLVWLILQLNAAVNHIHCEAPHNSCICANSTCVTIMYS